jgi:small subunit ribosomal protein S27Ae
MAKKYERHKLFSIESNKVDYKNRTCPKCGEGVFMAEHVNRISCGKCGYTEFKKGK